MVRLPPPPSLVFRVQKCEPELVAPAKPTPHEFKPLSDIDDQDGVRFQILIIQFYEQNPSLIRQGSDPVKVIREALAQTLVYYYPLAGRLREGPERKLIVECTGEGVMFIEANADVRLEDFGEAIYPPIPCLDQLIFDVPGSAQILNAPLMLIQVTRLLCGGFVFALRLNHTICDGSGLYQFVHAVAEMARSASAPSIPPVWQRQLLTARNPPRVTCTHHEFDELDETKDIVFPAEDMTHITILFTPSEISAIRKHAPNHLHRSSTFDLLTACIWRSAIKSLHLDPSIEVRTVFPVNVRSKFDPPVPTGYYGNAYTLAFARATAGELCQMPFGYALEVVKTTKEIITEEYMRSQIDLLVIKGRPSHTSVGACYVSGMARMGFQEVDFGWGKAVYGGRAKVWGGAKPRVASLYSPLSYRGEKGIAVTVYFPNWAVGRFMEELGILIKEPPNNGSNNSRLIRTPL